MDVSNFDGRAQATVTLREITASTIRAVIALRVAPGQEGYVADNAASIALAHFHPEAWFRAVCAGPDLVGFAMLRDETQLRPTPPDARLSLWRLMIDHRFQRLGYGGAALELVCERARSRPGVESIETSYVEGELGPRDFYLAHGFRHTGAAKPNGEICLARDLR